MATHLTRTICCKLAVDEQDTLILAATARAFNAAATWVAQVCWDEGLTERARRKPLGFSPGGEAGLPGL